jgi:EAL domain-containing protein (putative c-di-GMP-specific phosphodiesterase class I)
VQRNDQVGLFARSPLADPRRSLTTHSLTLAYQPQVDAQGRVAGGDALLRCAHVRHGPMAPDVVLTLTEEGGDTALLGPGALDAACACKADCNRQGPGALTMAVNVSPLQPTDPGLAQVAASASARPGPAAPGTGAGDQRRPRQPRGRRGRPDAAATGRAGRATGHGRRRDGADVPAASAPLPLHTLKIDGSITRDVMQGATSVYIIRAIVELGRSRRMDNVAEFVETPAQAQLLRVPGCHPFNGDLHSAPLTAAACATFICTREVTVWAIVVEEGPDPVCAAQPAVAV